MERQQSGATIPTSFNSLRRTVLYTEIEAVPWLLEPSLKEATKDDASWKDFLASAVDVVPQVGIAMGRRLQIAPRCVARNPETYFAKGIDRRKEQSELDSLSDQGDGRDQRYRLAFRRRFSSEIRIPDQPSDDFRCEFRRAERTTNRQLQRSIDWSVSLLIALSEYVPGAVLLVGGKVLESKGILKHWTETNRDEALMLNYWALNCANGHEYLATSQSGLCPHCQMGPADPGQMLMFPRFGYTHGGMGAAEASRSQVGSYRQSGDVCAERIHCRRCNRAKSRLRWSTRPDGLVLRSRQRRASVSKCGKRKGR